MSGFDGSGLSKYMQPLNFISNYYGERYGFYFAWLAYYTAMLVPISIIGVIFFVLQIINYNQDGGNLKGALDWEWNFIFSILVSLWATLVLEGWKQTQARIGNTWLMRDYKTPATDLPNFKYSVGVDKDLK